MISKLKEHFLDVISCIIGLLGVIASFVSAFITDTNGLGYICFIILATEAMLVGIGIWNYKIKHSYENKRRELEMKLENLQNDYERYKQNVNIEKKQKLQEYNEKNKNISIIVTNIKNASKLNSELCNRIPQITEKSYHLLETLLDSKVEDDNIISSEIKKSYQEFFIGLYDLYNRYSSHLLNYIIVMLETYLRYKGISQELSSTIKLFNKPLFRDELPEDIIVYTAFRDKKTYDKNEREIGAEPYTIKGNVDFVRCLQKDHYIMNNEKKDSESYFNEHVDFDSYYNCAVVVPLRIKQADNSYKFLGYLCCDCLNLQESIDVFDKEMAQLLFSMAQQYAMFLETLDSNWIDRIMNDQTNPQSFLELIFERTYTGKHK